MANLTNTNGFVSNPQFSGGEAVTPLSGAAFGYANQGYGGLYVGTAGTLVVKTINGNVLTLVSASGFIPGIIGAVSSSSTAADIIGFDPKPVAPATTTTSTSTTSTTSTTTAGAPASFSLNSGSYTGTPGSAVITGIGSVYYYTCGPEGGNSPTKQTLYFAPGTLWGNFGAYPSIQGYTDSGLTTLYTGTGQEDFTAWGHVNSCAVRFFNKTTNTFGNGQV